MTFEEFFIKKKIDLGLLKSQLPALYDEFLLHFGLMGEKSFDHTKKYWFNRLRKDFLLRDERVSIPPKAEILPEKSTSRAIDSQANSPSAKPVGFKPRFKAGVTPTNAPDETAPKIVVEEPKAEEEASKTDIPLVEPPTVAKPVGFKPRFKAGITQIKKDPPPENEV